LGSGCFVGPGVAVGGGAVLGARAVAVRDLEAGCVYVGNPARLVRRRRTGGFDG
jgi:putative colanic acid biosynthesis acetyltransferase WcaF